MLPYYILTTWGKVAKGRENLAQTRGHRSKTRTQSSCARFQWKPSERAWVSEEAAAGAGEGWRGAAASGSRCSYTTVMFLKPWFKPKQTRPHEKIGYPAMERYCILQKQLWNSSDKYSKHFLQQGRALCSNHSNQVTARLGAFRTVKRTPGWGTSEWGRGGQHCPCENSPAQQCYANTRWFSSFEKCN